MAIIPIMMTVKMILVGKKIDFGAYQDLAILIYLFY